MSQRETERAQAEDFWKGVNDSLRARITELNADRDRLSARLAEVEKERDEANDYRKEVEHRLEWWVKAHGAALALAGIAQDQLDVTTRERDEARALKVPAPTEAVLQAQMAQRVAETERDFARQECERMRTALAEAVNLDERDAEVMLVARIVLVAKRVVSRGMHNRTPDRDTFLQNDIEILAKLADAVNATDKEPRT
jgi:hypothetical protein